MGLPHINVLTKCDKIQNKKFLDDVTEASSCKEIVSDQMNEQNFFSKKFFKLNQVIVDVVDNFSLVNFQQLDISEEESVVELIAMIDSVVQYDEYRMPKDNHFPDEMEQPDMPDLANMQMWHN